MPSPPRCCNLFDRPRHNNIYHNLTFVNGLTCKLKLALLDKNFVCAACKLDVYKGRVIERIPLPVYVLGQEEADEINTSTSSSDSKETKDESFQSSEGEDEDSEEPTIRSSQEWVEEVKLALSKAKNRAQKVAILTTVPTDAIIRTTAKWLGVTRYLVKKGRALRRKEGYGATPAAKAGRSLDPATKQAVIDFYLSEQYSRVLPGAKDYKSIKVQGNVQESP